MPFSRESRANARSASTREGVAALGVAGSGHGGSQETNQSRLHRCLLAGAQYSGRG